MLCVSADITNRKRRKDHSVGTGAAEVHGPTTGEKAAKENDVLMQPHVRANSGSSRTKSAASRYKKRLDEPTKIVKLGHAAATSVTRQNIMEAIIIVA